jgi:hypothetical protein
LKDYEGTFLLAANYTPLARSRPIGRIQNQTFQI